MEQTITFFEFCSHLNLEEYPFSTFNAESEKRNGHNLFIQPQNHSVLLQGLKNNLSHLIIGERGTGKTALSYEMKRSIDISINLIVYIDDYSSLKLNHKPEDYYRFLSEQIASVFFQAMTDDASSFWKYTKEERVELSFFLAEYVKPASRKILTAKISSIQNHLPKRACIWTYNAFRVFMNYGIHALTYAANNAITKHFAALPPVDSKVPEYLAPIKTEVDTTFDKGHKEYFYLCRLTELINKSKFKHTTVIIDKIDEDTRLENDAEDIAEFLENIASDNKILLHNRFNVLLFIWTVPFNYLKGNVRTQKLSVQKLAWTRHDLLDALSRRLNVFSKSMVTSYEQLFSVESIDEVDKIIAICNENPRDLWHIMDKIIISEFRISPISVKLSKEAIHDGISDFVKSFNYYEYYPKRSNARSNSMDVYSYIKHLSKLSTTEFTKDQLNTEAGTGSSTTNYVTNMENMGLIVRSESKALNGAALYKIKDPKVLYAISHGLEIERSAI